jgi:Yip1 domain
MFDWHKTLDLVKGGLLDPRPTWESYHAENRPWTDTAMTLTAPLILSTAVLVALLSWIFRHHYLFGYGRGGVLGFLLGIIVSTIGVLVAAFVFSFLAGVFKGTHDFNRGFAAVSLAMIPGYVGNVLGTLPWLGWLLSLALAILSLVYLYRIVPLYLNVPQDKRPVHYVVSLIACFVVMLVVAMVLGVGVMESPARHMTGEAPSNESYGLLGGLGRQAEIMDAAEKDRFDPPADGRISDVQMQHYLGFMRKTAELRADQRDRLKKLEQETQGKKDLGLSDLGQVAGGIGTMLGTVTAEMEVVKTGSGNWAEHQWVKEQLHLARVQKDISDAVKHNYAMYQKHATELEKYDAAP